MAAPWEVVNPDNAVDLLPQPYRMITEVLEDEILLKVERKIANINAKRKSEEYEHALPQVWPTASLLVPGHITVTAAEPRGAPRVALGTNHGEVWLVDTAEQAVVARKNCFAQDEAVHGIALASDGAYAPAAAPLEKSPPRGPRGKLKVLVSGVQTPRVLVYDACREAYGVSLQPACAIHVKQPEEQETPLPWIEQLHARGATEGVWVLVLQADRRISVYLCPLGTPPDATGQGGDQQSTLAEVAEEEEEEAADHDQGGGDDFARAPQLHTALYSFDLGSLAPLRGMPEPALERVTLTVFAPCAERRSIAYGTSSRQVPLICAASSPDSNVVLGYSLRAPEPVAAPQGLAVDKLLLQSMPLSGEPPPPEAPQMAMPRRRWELPAETTATAASPCGSLFAAGGAKGALALIDTGPGLSLRTMLPGHYAAVTGLSFHRAEILVSVGADGWVHHYSVQDHTVLARYKCAPPLSVPSAEEAPAPEVAGCMAQSGAVPVQFVAAAQQLAVAMSLDAGAGLRLLDLRRGRKAAIVTCHEPDPRAPSADGPGGGEPPDVDLRGDSAESAVAPSIEELPLPEERPRLVLTGAAGFCVVCQADDRATAPVPGEGELQGEEPAEAGDGDEREEASGAAPDTPPERSFLVLFEHASTLSRLFPGLQKVKGRTRGLTTAFNSMSLEELAKEQASTMESGLSEELGAVATTALGDGFGAGGTRRTQCSAASKVSRQTLQKNVPREMVVKLTAENLSKMDKPPAADGDLTLLAPSPAAAVKNKSPHQLSSNWQVAARRHLRGTVAEREVRGRRIAFRLEQLRKDLGDS